MMGLPKMKKRPRETNWSEGDMERLKQVAGLLGCTPFLSSILQHLENKKASLDGLRTRLGLCETSYALQLNDVELKINQLKEAASLELSIQEVLNSIPFRRASLVVSITKEEGRHNSFEASLWAREKHAQHSPRGPWEMPTSNQLDRHMLLLDNNTASTMAVAIKGLKAK